MQYEDILIKNYILNRYNGMRGLLLRTVKNFEINVRNSDPIEWDSWDEFVVNTLIPEAEKLLGDV